MTRNDRNTPYGNAQENPAMYAATQPALSDRQPWNGVRTSRTSDYPAASMWRGTVLQVTPQGYEESFAIGPDGYVWSYQTGQTAGPGAGRLLGTGLEADAFAVGRARDGQLVVLAAEDDTLRFVVEVGEGASRWSEPREARLPVRGNAMRIERVFAEPWGGELYFAMLVRMADANGRELCFLWDATWNGQSLVFSRAPVDWAHGNVFWLERMAEEGIAIN